MEMDPNLAQSVRLSGRVIAALAVDANLFSKTGGIFTVSDMAEEYNVIDPDHE